MKIQNTKDLPSFYNEDYLFVEQAYMKLFDKEVLKVIIKHAKELFTPQALLNNIILKLRTESQFLKYSISELKSYCNENQNKKFNELINSNKFSNNYTLYILFCDPLNDLKNLKWSATSQIIQDYNETPKCPAKRYSNNKCSIIILNSKIISISDSIGIELQLDHELNHLFEELEENKKEIKDINEQAQDEIKTYLKENNIIEKKELNSFDFNLHMFSKKEFYEMTANVCNVLSLYLKEENELKIFNKFDKMLDESYLKSIDFQKLEEPIRGAVIFAFICKKYSPERWESVLSLIRGQLNLKGFKGSLKFYFNRIIQNFKNFLK